MGRGRSRGIGPPFGRWVRRPPKSEGALYRAYRAPLRAWVRARLFAPARFARLIARARRRAHVSRPLPPGFFAAPDAALSAEKEKGGSGNRLSPCSYPITLFPQSSPWGGLIGKIFQCFGSGRLPAVMFRRRVPCRRSVLCPRLGAGPRIEPVVRIEELCELDVGGGRQKRSVCAFGTKCQFSHAHPRPTRIQVNANEGKLQRQPRSDT